MSSLYHTLYPTHYKLGTAAVLDLSAIPETEKACQVIKEWVRDSIYNLSPREEHFLTDIAELTTLAYEFNRTEAQLYIPTASCIADSRHRPHTLMRGIAGGGRYIVSDLIEAIDGTSDAAVSAGILFIQCVFRRMSLSPIGYL